MIEYTDEQHDSLIRGHRKQLADAQAQIEALQADNRSYINERYENMKQLEELRQQVEALQRERDGLEAKCLEEHVTAEQAQAALDAERAQVQGLCTDICQIETQMEAAGITEYAVDGEPKSVFGQLDELIQQRDTYRQQLDAEREKVKGLEAQCADLERKGRDLCLAHGPLLIEHHDVKKQLSQLQALVRALPVLPESDLHLDEVWARLKRGNIGIDLVLNLLRYRATLDATTPAPRQRQVHSCEIPGCVSCANPEAGGDGE